VGVSAAGTVAGEAGAGDGCALLSRDRCRRAGVGRAILGITISHFASSPDGPGPAGFKACFDKACFDKAWFDKVWFDKVWFDRVGFVVATSMVAATGSPGAGADIGLVVDFGIACTGAGLA